MNKPLQIGITGGIGSGKSIVCQIFSVLGAPVYNADTRARQLMNTSKDLKSKILSLFGKESYTGDGIDRNFIASKVFKDASMLEKLNAIVHPAVGDDYMQWVNQQDYYYTIKEAALMFESGSYKALDKVFNVSAPITLRIERTLKRDPFRTEEEIKAIISKQLSEEERIKRSNGIIYNDEMQLLIPQILKLHNGFIIS